MTKPPNDVDLRRAYERSHAYRCLGMSLTSPVETFFPTIEDIAKYREYLESVYPDAEKTAQRWVLAAGEKNPDELLVEYSRLFVGPFHIPAPPYGSVYLDGDGRMMGKSTVQVKEYYLESGLAIDSSFHDVPDHISVELEFMQYLCYKQWKANADGDVDRARTSLSRQRHFLGKFLAAWVPEFAAKVRNSTTNSFYVAVADNLPRFIDEELRAIT